jgi:hypothetical protein
MAVALYIALTVFTRWEVAKAPGEKSLGAAVLFIAFGIPMFLSAGAGMLCWLAAVFLLANKRFRSPSLTETSHGVSPKHE